MIENQVIAIVYTLSKESHILIETFTHFGNVMDRFQQAVVPKTLKKNKTAVGKLARLLLTWCRGELMYIFDYQSKKCYFKVITNFSHITKTFKN